MIDKEQYLLFLVISLLIISLCLAVFWPTMILVVLFNALALEFILSPVVLVIKTQAAIETGILHSQATLDLMMFVSIFVVTWMSIPIFRRITGGMDRRNLITYLGATQVGNIAIFTYQHVTPVGFLSF